MSYTRKPTRILSLVLALVIICGLVPVVSTSANAEGGVLDREFYPIVDDQDAESQNIPYVWLSDFTYNGLDISIPFMDDSYMHYSSSIHFLTVTDKHDTYLAFCIDPTGKLGADYLQNQWKEDTALGSEIQYLNSIYHDPVVNWFYAGYYNTLLQRTRGCGDSRLPLFTDEYLLVFYLLTQGVIWELNPDSTKLTDDSKYVDEVSKILSTILSTIKTQYPSVAEKIPNALNLSEGQIKAAVQAIKTTSTRDFNFDYNIYTYDNTTPEGLIKGEGQSFVIGIPNSTPTDSTNTNFWIKINKRDKDTQEVLTGTKFKITCLQGIGASGNRVTYYADFCKDNVFTFSDPDTPIGPFSAPSGANLFHVKIEEVDAAGNHVNNGKSYEIDIPKSKMGTSSADAVSVTGTEVYENPTIHPRVFFKVKKTDSQSGEKLAGAAYQVFESQQDAQNGSNSKYSFTTQTDGDDVYGYIQYDDLTSLDQLPSSYWLKEVQAPGGYVANEEPFEVSVDITKHYESDSDPQSTVLVTVPEEKTKNSRPPHGVWIRLIKKNEEGEQLAGVTFNVYKDESCQQYLDWIATGSSPTGQAYVALPEDMTGEVTLYFKEKAPLPGYKANDTVYSVTANTETNNVNSNPAIVHDKDTPDNAYITNEQLPPVYISVEKRDQDGAGLNGAEFTVYADAACTQVLGTITSSSSGPVTKEFHVEKTTLYVKETKAPSAPDANHHYEIDNTAYPVEVDPDLNNTPEQAAVVKAANGNEYFTNTLENTPPPTIDPDDPGPDPTPTPPSSDPNAILQKYDSRTSEALPGAVFEFAPTFDGTTARFITDANGAINLQSDDEQGS